MFKRLFHPKQNQDPTLFEKSWGVFRLGRISARTILIAGTILTLLISNWTGNALQAILVALFSSSFGIFSNGLTYALHFLSASLLNPDAFFENEGLINLFSGLNNYPWLGSVFHWVGFGLMWYLFVWRPFIHLWTKSRNLNHNEQGNSRVATPEEVRWQTFKVPDRRYNYGKHPGFPVMHTFNWRGKLNHMIKTEMGATQNALHINNFEVRRLYVYTMIALGVIIFLLAGSTTWGEIAYHTTGSAPVLSLFQVTHPLIIIIGWLISSFFRLLWMFCKMQVVGIHYPFMGGLFYLVELFGLGWLIAHIKDVRRHYKNGFFHAIAHGHFFYRIHRWYARSKSREQELARNHKTLHVNNAAETDPALEDVYYHDDGHSVKVIDCFFHHPCKTLKLAYMVMMSVLVDLDAGITGWYYLSPRPHNVWIYGTSGSGKGQMVVNPSMDINSRADPKDKPNMIVTDPKGESAAGASVMLKKRGYNVKVMNILDLSHSMSFNPLRLVIKYAQLGAVGQAEDSCSQLSYTIYDPSGQGQNSYFYTSAASLFDAMTFALIALAHSRYYGLNDLVTCNDNGKKVNVCDDGQYKKGSQTDSEGHRVQKLSDGKYHSDVDAFDKVTIRNISEMVAQLGGQEGQESDQQEPEKRLMIYFDHLSDELNKLRSHREENPDTFNDIQSDQLSILDQAVQKFQQSKLAGSKTAGSIYSTFLDKLRIYMSSDVAKMTSMDNFNPAEMGFDRLLTIQFNRDFKLQDITNKSWTALKDPATGRLAEVVENDLGQPIDTNGKPILKDIAIVSGHGDKIPAKINDGEDFNPDAKKRLNDVIYAYDHDNHLYHYDAKHSKMNPLSINKSDLASRDYTVGYMRDPFGYIETNEGHLSEIGVGHIPFEKPINGNVFFVTIDLHDERVGRNFYFTFQCDKQFYDASTYEKINNDYQKAPEVADLKVEYRYRVYDKEAGKVKTYTRRKLDDKKAPNGYRYIPYTKADYHKSEKHINRELKNGESKSKVEAQGYIYPVVIDKYTGDRVLHKVKVHMVNYPQANAYNDLPNSSSLRELARHPLQAYIKQQTTFLFNPHPTAWFIVAPQNKQELNQLGTFAIGQTFNVLSGISMSFTNGRHVQRPLQMILDELGNLPAIRHLDRMASFGRSQHIYIMPIFQAREQADQIYQKDVTNIVYDNCPTTVYILSNSEETIKEISDGFGNRTITNTTRSYDPAKIKSINYNENEAQQKVMPPDVLRNLRLGEAAILRTTDRTNDWGQNTNPWPIFDWDGMRDQPNGHLKKEGPNHILPYAWWFLGQYFSHGSLGSVPIVTPHKYLDLETLTIQFDNVYLWMEANNPLDTTLFNKLCNNIQQAVDKWDGTEIQVSFLSEIARANDKHSNKHDKDALHILFDIQQQMKFYKPTVDVPRGCQVGLVFVSGARRIGLNVLNMKDYTPSIDITGLYHVLFTAMHQLRGNVDAINKVMRSTDASMFGAIGSRFNTINEITSDYLYEIGLVKSDNDSTLTPRAVRLINNPKKVNEMLGQLVTNYDPKSSLGVLVNNVLQGLKTSPQLTQYRGLMFLAHALSPRAVHNFVTNKSGVEYGIGINKYACAIFAFMDAVVMNNSANKPRVSKAYGQWIEKLNQLNKDITTGKK